MTNIPRPQEIYKHFKGNLYQIITVAEHSETGERLVIYQALYGDFRIYARELNMFLSRVDRKKYPNATQEYRFMLVDRETGKLMQETAQTAIPTAQTETKPTPAAARTEAKPAPAAAQTETKPAPAAARTEAKPAAETAQAAAKQTSEAARPEAKPAPAPAQEAASGEAELDPLLLEFLDAKTYDAKLNILAGLHHRITDYMITTMAVACDVEIGDGELEDRYRQLKSCLMMMEKYECNRLRQ